VRLLGRGIGCGFGLLISLAVWILLIVGVLALIGVWT
jgi:hypothetical protein